MGGKVGRDGVRLAMAGSDVALVIPSGLLVQRNGACALVLDREDAASLAGALSISARTGLVPLDASEQEHQDATGNGNGKTRNRRASAPVTLDQADPAALAAARAMLRPGQRLVVHDKFHIDVVNTKRGQTPTPPQ